MWQDTNFDGVSQRDELQPLVQLGITRIDTTFKDVAEENRYQSFGYCGARGCGIFDVYFGTSNAAVSGN